MLTVKATLGQSKIHGFGLIARERIAKGTMTWKFDSRFDLLFDPAEVAHMPQAQQLLIKTYAILVTEKWEICVFYRRHTIYQPFVATRKYCGKRRSG